MKLLESFEGLSPDQVIKLAALFEVLDYYADNISQSSILEKIGLKQGQYFVVSSHRENVDAPENLMR